MQRMCNVTLLWVAKVRVAVAVAAFVFLYDSFVVSPTKAGWTVTATLGGHRHRLDAHVSFGLGLDCHRIRKRLTEVIDRGL